MMNYPFTEEEARVAYDEWGCNCGPTALAFALQTSLDVTRRLIADFDQKRYTSPAMMLDALIASGRQWRDIRPVDTSRMFQVGPSLVRIQWTGPWTQPGANPKWAYRQTHWITTFLVERQAAMVFDVNGGIMGFQRWQSEIVPLILKSYPRSDGGWHPTHIWTIC